MELNAPLRIYWDLPPASDGSCDHRQICEQILAVRVLALDLLNTGDSITPALWEVLETLRGKGVAVTVTARAGALTPSVRKRVTESGVCSLLLLSSSLTELTALPAEYWSGSSFGVRGVSFQVGEENFLEIPELLRFCAANGIGRLVFPIQRAGHGAPLFHLTPELRAALEPELRRQELPEKLQLMVHDPFLWKAIYPDAPFPEGGCQAANSMLYIAPDAAVYPCPVMPYRLDDPDSSTLAHIISSWKKKDLRQNLLAPPSHCLSCSELKHCLGGCRGRGYVAVTGWDAADPACGW